jgi:mono/diheme cytochrome c family protein
VRLSAAGFVCLIALLAAGCGTGGTAPANADKAAGKLLFVNGAHGQQSCGSCHTLADAGTTGTLGPNLDSAYAGDRVIGMKDSSFEAMVRQQIDLADPPMPRHLLKGSDADDVAAYVASVAGVDLAKQYNPGYSPP